MQGEAVDDAEPSLLPAEPVLRPHAARTLDNAESLGHSSRPMDSRIDREVTDGHIRPECRPALLAKLPRAALVVSSLALCGGLAQAHEREFTLSRDWFLPYKGEHELELHPTEGHVADGMAIWIPWARVLVCGDHLSPVEIPMLSEGGSVSAYRATLERLRPLVEGADHVVPGHGAVLDAARALAILREDLAYLETWELPLARRSREQRRIHAENLERAGVAP